jgi:dTDP-4-amino-4,6-dideoxygalactose transaminase
MVTPVERIPMSDLDAQHAPLRPDLEAAAGRVLASSRFILGAEVAAFEGELAAALGVAHAVGVSSGTDAVLALLMAAGVGPGDEVVTTPYSFFATVEAIVRLGARPVFADVDPDTLNVDPDLAAARLNGRTRAVVVVHLFGRMARTAPLAAACAAAGIPLIEDAAQAIGAWRGPDGGGREPVGGANQAGEIGHASAAGDLPVGRRAAIGSIGAGAALSFFPAKNLGGFGDGGMVITNDEAIAARVRLLRNHGASGKLRHDVIGGNFRLDELQAALLRVKLPALDRWTQERRRLAARYRQRLAELPLRLPPWDDGCVWNQFVVGVPDDSRDVLAEHLDRRGIASSVYYPIPLHLQPALAHLGHRPGDFPRAELAARQALALPIFPELGDQRLARVADAVADFFR